MILPTSLLFWSHIFILFPPPKIPQHWDPAISYISLRLKCVLSLLDISSCPLTILLEMIRSSPKPVFLKFLWCRTPWRKTLPASVDSTSLYLLLLKSCALGTQVLVYFIFFSALWRFFFPCLPISTSVVEKWPLEEGLFSRWWWASRAVAKPLLVLLRSATMTCLMSLCFRVFSSGVLTSCMWRCPSAGRVGHSALLDSLLPADSF